MHNIFHLNTFYMNTESNTTIKSLMITLGYTGRLSIHTMNISSLYNDAIQENGGNKQILVGHHSYF